MLAHRSQQCMKDLDSMTQFGSLQGCMADSTLKISIVNQNRLNKKNYIVTSNNVENAFAKLQHPFMI